MKLIFEFEVSDDLDREEAEEVLRDLVDVHEVAAAIEETING
jgi:hypothetical protein